MIELEFTPVDDGSVAISGFDSFNLHDTCQCGQAFRWVRRGDVEEGVVAGRLLRVEQCGGELLVHAPAGPEDVRLVVSYFRLAESHSAIESALEALDEVMAKAVPLSRGLRLVAQEPWECLISYILSANNSVQQISRVVESMCDVWGPPVTGDGPRFTARRAFPAAAVLAATEECDIRSCKAGFRARAVCEAAQHVASGNLDLEELRRTSVEEARARLVELHGVGNKIADCVLLFSLDKFDAFPVDVWIERAVRHLYFAGAPMSHAQIRKFAADHFGALAGYAQEYLFNYARMHIPEVLRGH